MLDRAGLWRRFAVSTTLGLVGAAPLPSTVAASLDRTAASTATRTPTADTTNTDNTDDDLSTDFSTIAL
jgi:hypothetical protein